MNELDFCIRRCELVIMGKSLILCWVSFCSLLSFCGTFFNCSFINDTAENTRPG